MIRRFRHDYRDVPRKLETIGETIGPMQCEIRVRPGRRRIPIEK